MNACDWVTVDGSEESSELLSAFMWWSEEDQMEEIDATGVLVVRRANGNREAYEGVDRWVYNALAHRAAEDGREELDAFFRRHVLDVGEPTATR